MPDKYETGNKKPPKHSQFQKGRSGNPKGRPRKKPFEQPQMTGLDIMKQPIAKMIEEEALRPVTITDSKGNTEEIPVIQAILCSLAHKAAKGDRLAALSAVLDAKKIAADHPDWPGAKFLTENGIDLDRVRINSNGLIDVDAEPAEITPDQMIELVVSRNQIADDIGDARERLTAAEDVP